MTQDSFKISFETTGKIVALIDELKGVELDDLVLALNSIRQKLHSISPFESEPVDFVKWVPIDSVVANDWNLLSFVYMNPEIARLPERDDVE